MFWGFHDKERLRDQIFPSVQSIHDHLLIDSTCFLGNAAKFCCVNKQP